MIYINGFFKRKHKTSDSLAGANEATRCEFVSSVIHGVVHCYEGKVKVYPQYEISGSHGKGPVDWAIKFGNTIIAVTEAKRENLDQGVRQNVIQLQASTQCNPRKRKFDSALQEDTMFGIITTGVYWIIIKVVSNGTDEDSSSDKNNVQVFLSSRLTLRLPIDEEKLQQELLEERLEELFGQLVWIFDQQLESQSESKRRRTL